jgi:hypothetical protein
VVRANAGSVAKLRVRLQPEGNSTASPETVKLNLKVPNKVEGRTASALVAGNGYDPNRGGKADDLESYLDKLSGRPGNDVVSAAFRFNRPKVTVTDSATADASVAGYFFFRVRAR